LSEHSWLVDIPAKRFAARQEAQPLRGEINKKQETSQRKVEELKRLKASLLIDKAAIEKVQSEIANLDKEVRDLANKISALEDAVYDLKAVNPNAVNTEDTRTPVELITLIEEQGRILADALEALKAIS
jgi:type I restriction enzyme M protein